MMPKSFINLDNIKENLITQKNLSPSQEMRLKLLQGIVLYRINKRKRFVTFDDSFFTDAQFFFEDDFILQNQLGREFETTIKLESNIFCFLVRSLFFNIDTFTKKTEIVSQYKNSNLTITQQINFIL
ncbi:TPA_asm: hypothetical protein GIM35_15690, partial [Listeria monocytogenes]|nr:hypothetical protein [Listeria monocytogenes]